MNLVRSVGPDAFSKNHLRGRFEGVPSAIASGAGAAYVLFVFSSLIGSSITRTGSAISFFLGAAGFYLVAVAINRWFYTRKGSRGLLSTPVPRGLTERCHPSGSAPRRLSQAMSQTEWVLRHTREGDQGKSFIRDSSGKSDSRRPQNRERPVKTT